MKELYGKKIKAVRIVSGAFVLAVLATIFILSAQKAEESDRVSLSFSALLFSGDFDLALLMNSLIREIAHMCEYAALSVPLFIFVSTFLDKTKLQFAIPAASSVLYAVSDEIHQYFVEGRACELKDVILDSSGAVIGIICIFLILRLIIKKKNKDGRK